MDRSIGEDKTRVEGGGSGGREPHSVNSVKTGGGMSDGALGRIDHFELLRELGGGGFGTVYLARDTVAGVEVAVKGLPPLVKNNAEELERIRANFALVSKLHHPNIAAALHLHPAQEVFYAEERTRQALRVLRGDTLMVMAYAPGVTLSKWRRQFPEGKVPVAQALEVCRQIASALDYAHSERVVHRDVKPSNVMVETRGESSKVLKCGSSEVGKCGSSEVEGAPDTQHPTPNTQPRVRVLDFGLAAEIRSSMSRVSQEKGDTSGTRPYMAPEQWAGRKQDGRTDQYSLAVLFYELVGGAVPFASAFDTGDPVIMANAAENKPPEPLAELSKAQNAALLRGLAKAPGERFGSCGELVEGLGGAASRRRGGRGGKRGIGYWVLGIGAAAAVSLLAYQAVQARSERRAAERGAAAQAAALDAAQRERVAGLKGAAEAALAAGDLEAAGARIAELGQAGGGAEAAELRKKYEAKAGERETNRRYAAASLAREAAQKLDTGQGFGEKLKALEAAWREAEAARQGGGWGQALSGYDAVLAACRTLEEMEMARGGAETRRGAAEEARRAAAGENAATDAAALFETGGRVAARAAEAFETGDFMAAGKAWGEAAAAYASSKTRALATQGYQKAKRDFDAALKPDESLLAKHGGGKWQEAQRQRRIGEASANDPAEGARAYAAALTALPGAVAEAKAAEKAEAERQAAEQKAAAEKARAGKIAAAVAAARQAKAAGQWQTCLDKAGEALGLEAGNAEALALKAEAEGKLKPKDPTLGNALGMAFVEVAPGSFTMGSNDGGADEKPVRTVRITKGFWMGKYEVTQAQWRQLMNDNPSYFKGDDLPVEMVSWDRCVEFCRALTERERTAGRLPAGYAYRLPTEAEWEYAARGGPLPKGTSNGIPIARRVYSYSGGDNIDTVAWYSGNSGGKTQPVGKKAANELGLYDMSGNVWEWCLDWYQDSYNGLGSADPAGPASGSLRVVRGGGWYGVASYCRSAIRYGFRPSYANSGLGFRVVLAPVP